MKGRGLFVVIFLGLLPLLGCSVSLQSTQYSFLAEMLQKKDPPPQKNWRVIWRNKEYLSYAVNFENGTYFANEEGLLVSFDGWQVVGLNLPGLGVKKGCRYRSSQAARWISTADLQRRFGAIRFDRSL